MKKTIYLLFLMLSVSLSSFAQENVEVKKSKLKVSATLQSMFYWRGAPLSVFSNPEAKPSPLMTGEVNYAFNDKFSVGVWTGQSFESHGYKNASYYVSYNIKGVNIALWDVFTYAGIGKSKSSDFFNFDDEETQHFIDLSFSYGFKKIPLSLFLATVIYGRDGAVINGNYQNRYSTYFKASYRVLDVEALSLDLYSSVGGALNDIDGNSFYGTSAATRSFGVTEVGLTGDKKIKVTENFSFVLSMGVVASPLNKRFDGILAIKL